MDLLHFGGDKNWLGSLMGGQPDDLEFGLMKKWKLQLQEGDIWATMAFNVGLMKKNTTFMIFDHNICAMDFMVCMCMHK